MAPRYVLIEPSFSSEIESKWELNRFIRACGTQGSSMTLVLHEAHLPMHHLHASTIVMARLSFDAILPIMTRSFLVEGCTRTWMLKPYGLPRRCQEMPIIGSNRICSPKSMRYNSNVSNPSWQRTTPDPMPRWWEGHTRITSLSSSLWNRELIATEMSNSLIFRSKSGALTVRIMKDWCVRWFR